MVSLDSNGVYGNQLKSIHMLLELAAIKYLFSDSSDKTLETEVIDYKVPAVSPGTVITTFFLLILTIGALFSALSAEQNFLQSVGWLVSGLKSLTVGAVSDLASMFDDLTIIGKIFLPIFMIIFWIFLLYVIWLISIHVAVPVNYIAKRLSNKARKIGLTIVVTFVTTIMVIGSSKFQNLEKEKEVLKREQQHYYGGGFY